MALDGNNLNQVIATAQKVAKNKSRIMYVIFEHEHTGDYHAVDSYTLDTWYQGNNQILYCTADHNLD